MSGKLSRRGFLRSFPRAAGAAALEVQTRAASQTSTSVPIPSSPLVAAGGRPIRPQKVLLWENTRKEVREALAKGDLKAAIIPTGSTEQHNEHLALICDIACATMVAQQAALRLYPQVTVSTPCPVGYSPYHMARKGTLTVRKETFRAYVFDVIKSLRAHGIRTMLVVNGHGGNHRLLQDALPEWRKDLGITLDAVSYWNGYTDEDFERHQDSGAGVSHAAEFETSLLLAAFPDRVRPFTLGKYDQADLKYESEADLSPGVREFLKPFKIAGENGRDRTRQEQALLATAEKGEALIGIATRFVAGRIEAMMAATEKGTPWPAA